MIFRIFKVGLFALLLVGVAAIVWVRRDNERLRRRVTDLNRQITQVVGLREENARTRRLVARATEFEGEAAGALHAEMEQLRGEIADLEQRAEERHANGKANGAALAANRDPEAGLVLMENFQDAGRATPSAAFQTMVWAATRGDDRAVASLLAFEPAARERAQAMIAALPEGARAKYPTPESLAALLFADVITGHAAARVMGQAFQDTQHATVTVGFGPTSEGRPLAMQWGATGWQLVVPDKAIDGILQKLSGATDTSAGK